MNKFRTILIAILVLSACSTLVLEPAEPEMGVRENSTIPMTKSGVVAPDGQLSDLEILHFFQTDHRSIIIQHVELRDSVYVQTLTEEDMLTFRITEQERAFGDAYVVQLNELIKHQ